MSWRRLVVVPVDEDRIMFKKYENAVNEHWHDVGEYISDFEGLDLSKRTEDQKRFVFDIVSEYDTFTPYDTSLMTQRLFDTSKLFTFDNFKRFESLVNNVFLNRVFFIYYVSKLPNPITPQNTNMDVMYPLLMTIYEDDVKTKTMLDPITYGMHAAFKRNFNPNIRTEQPGINLREVIPIRRPSKRTRAGSDEYVPSIIDTLISDIPRRLENIDVFIRAVRDQPDLVTSIHAYRMLTSYMQMEVEHVTKRVYAVFPRLGGPERLNALKSRESNYPTARAYGIATFAALVACRHPEIELTEQVDVGLTHMMLVDQERFAYTDARSVEIMRRLYEKYFNIENVGLPAEED